MGFTAKYERDQVMPFKERIEDVSKRKESRIVLALDFPFCHPEKYRELLVKAQNIINAVHAYVCAVKINHHLVLPLGTFDGVQKLVTQIHEKGLPTIMDCKANDIGATNQIIAEYYYAAGFDALIANPFVGWEQGLEPIFSTAKKFNRGVILLAYMSHKGANEGYGQTIYDGETGLKTAQYISFARKALVWKADGVVVGATYPEKISEVYELLGENLPIYSPGIGKQGGKAEKALRAGAKYLIVGRDITLEQNPGEKTKRLWDSLKHVA